MNDLLTVAAGPSLTVFPPRSDARRTVCVMGVSRGGTSVVAGIVRKLGVFMGDDLDPATGDDRAFLGHERRREIFQEPVHAEAKARFLGRAGELIRERNAAHDIWGWKDPLVADYVADILPQLRNPVFIFVTRDVGAIAQRMRIDHNTIARRALLGHIKAASRSYERIADLLGQRARPTLLVSYERALRAPVAAGHAIAGFLGADAIPGFDSWLEDYVVADWPASATASPGGTDPARQQAATQAVRALCDESLRPRHEGFLAAAAAAEPDIVLAGNKLYEAAVGLLNGGDPLAAQDRALAIINLHVPQCPALFDGALGVMAAQSFGLGPEPIHADVVCGAFYLLGLANLIGTLAQRALICLTTAEAMMRRRLQLRLPDSVLSAGNYWSCVFHCGLAGKAIGRGDLAEAARTRILAAATPLPVPELAPLGSKGLADMARRAAAEL